MSKSGIETRSGLRKRSNSRPKRIGSRSVMVSAQATSEPAPEPRPGPTGMPCAFAYLMKSAHDQEVARIVHAGDDVELEGQALRCIPPPWCLARGRARAGDWQDPPRPGGAIRRSRPPRALASAPTVKRGRIGLRVIGRNAQRSAISTVDASASGMSANSTAISARVLKRWSGVSWSRSVSAISRPPAMHSSASWAS